MENNNNSIKLQNLLVDPYLRIKKKTKKTMITIIVIETKSKEHERTLSAMNILNEHMSIQGKFSKSVIDYASCDNYY